MTTSKFNLNRQRVIVKRMSSEAICSRYIKHSEPGENTSQGHAHTALSINKIIEFRNTAAKLRVDSLYLHCHSIKMKGRDPERDPSGAKDD